MKKTILLISLLFVATLLFAGDLVMIHVKNNKTLSALFEQSNLKIHYYNDRVVIATAEKFNANEMMLLDRNAFSETDHYCMVYCNQEYQSEYIHREENNGIVLCQTSNFLVIKPLNSQLLPAKNDGMVAIFNTVGKLPQKSRDYPTVTEEDPVIRSLMNQVSADSTLATIQQLQDYETRFYNSAEALEAQTWLAAQYEAMGLNVTIQNFSISGSPSSPNVIAIQQGTLYPDEYVVCGGHYDSFTWEAYYGYGIAPGADDNASGCSGILETARILSQNQFERSIIYCAFSGEELGLYGSAAYASLCQNQGMNIVGYFNLDMTGYLQAGDSIHIDLIYPESASPLAEFYLNVCNTYFPQMDAAYAYFSGGDSDHTSFNNNGYQGIFPFEDVNHHSPNIHTENDLIGLSVNNIEQVKRFTEVNVAAVATLAFPVGTVSNCNPVNLTADLQEHNAVLTWNEIDNAQSYSIYRDGEILATDIIETSFIHENIPFGTNCYTVKTICSDGESDFSNEACVDHSYPCVPSSDLLAIVNDNQSITLYWNPVEGAQSYNVYINGEIGLENITDTTVTSPENMEIGVYCAAISTNCTSSEESEKTEENCVEILSVNELERAVQLFPNPADQQFSIWSKKIEKVQIFNTLGQCITTVFVNDSHCIINTSNYLSGIYIVRLITEDHSTIIKRVVVQH